jgi:uncharacterized protein (TIGR01244 family)
VNNLSIDIERLTPGIVNGLCPLPGLATGGQPDPDDLASLAQAGVRTILDTREPGERRGFDEAAAVARAGMKYVNVPVGTTIDDTLFDRVRDVLRREERPILVHCATGNRVGLVLIPYLILDEGKSKDEAVALAARMGMRSPQLAHVALRYVARAQSTEKQQCC